MAHHGTAAATRTRMRMRIAVVGYGSAGQATAVLLSRDGHDVEVFERVAATRRMR